jgi:hypothetical protein
VCVCVCVCMCVCVYVCVCVCVCVCARATEHVRVMFEQRVNDAEEVRGVPLPSSAVIAAPLLMAVVKGSYVDVDDDVDVEDVDVVEDVVEDDDDDDAGAALVVGRFPC